MKKIIICLAALLIASCSMPSSIDETAIDVTDKTVIFYKFTADWCPPCKQQKPIVDAISKDYPNIEFITVDTDKDPDTASKYNVQSIPTMVITVDGQQTDYLQGLHSHEDLKRVLDRYKSGEPLN